MTRKSKAQQKSVIQENGDNPTAEEFECVKQQNVNFAKLLDEYKLALTEAREERDQARRELLGERAFNQKILSYVSQINKAAKSNLNTIVSSSNHVTEIIKATNAIHHLTNKDKTIHTDSVSAGNSPSKTQVVNPMIAGHVILRPIINLQRVNEISSEEIRRLSNPHRETNNSNLINNYTDTNEEPSSPTASNQSTQSGVIRHRGGNDNPILEFKFEEEPRRSLDNEFEQSDRLHTIMEGSQESGELGSNILELSRPGCSRQPLLSGVFHDVRMYVSSVPEMLDNINTQRGSSTKSLKLTRSPNVTSKSSSRNKSCLQNNVLEDNFNLSGGDNFNLATPVLSSTRLNASSLTTEPRPSTSFRRDDDLSNSPVDGEQTVQELNSKSVTFSNVVTRKGKKINVTVLQSPDSCSKTPEKDDQLNTTNNKGLRILESASTPTSSKIDVVPLTSERFDMKVSRRKKVTVNSTSETKSETPKRGRPKGKKVVNNRVTVPIKRITRSKYRRPIKNVDNLYTGRKSDQSRKSGSLELKENNTSDVPKSPTNASKKQSKSQSVTVLNDQSIVSNNLTDDESTIKNQSNVSKNQSVILNNQSIASNNLTSASKSGNFSRNGSETVNDTTAATKPKRSGKRKMQESSNGTAASSPKKLRGARAEVSLKEPSLRKKMRR